MTVNLITLTPFAIGLIGFAATVIASVVVVRASATKTTIASQKELIDTFDKELKLVKEKQAEDRATIEVLKGQIEVLRTIPLKEIAHEMTKISKSQEKILESLVASAGGK